MHALFSCSEDICTISVIYCFSLNLFCFREKKQKIQDIKNNIKEAIEVSVLLVV